MPSNTKKQGAFTIFPIRVIDKKVNVPYFTLF